MKKTILLAALTFSSMSFANNSPVPDLGKEIGNKAIFNLNEVELDAQNRDFVSVKFNIVNDEINILNINGSQDILKERVQEKLKSIQIESVYEANKTYIVKFRFENE